MKVLGRTEMLSESPIPFQIPPRVSWVPSMSFLACGGRKCEVETWGRTVYLHASLVPWFATAIYTASDFPLGCILMVLLSSRLAEKVSWSLIWGVCLSVLLPFSSKGGFFWFEYTEHRDYSLLVYIVLVGVCLSIPVMSLPGPEPHVLSQLTPATCASTTSGSHRTCFFSSLLCFHLVDFCSNFRMMLSSSLLLNF